MSLSEIEGWVVVSKLKCPIVHPLLKEDMLNCNLCLIYNWLVRYGDWSEEELRRQIKYYNTYGWFPGEVEALDKRLLESRPL